MIDRCCWVKDEKSGDMYFLPTCMGGAAQGPEGCTCQTLDERIDHLEKRNEHFECEVAELMRNVESVIEFIRKEFNEQPDFLTVEESKKRMYERWVKKVTSVVDKK